VFHITAEGPKRCEATVRECPVGGAHFKDRVSALHDYEERLEQEHTPLKSTKRTGLKAQLERTRIRITSKELKGKTLVISDVDGTIIKGSLVNDHAVWLQERGIIDLGDLPARWKADPKNEELITEVAVNYIKALKGKTAEELRIDEFIDEVLDNKRYYSSLKDLIEYRQSGHDVVLISGSPTYLVGNLAKRFGFQTVATRYHMNKERKFNGRITGMFSADSKRSVIERLDMERYDMIVGYGDTASDKPLLEVSTKRVLVDPTKETLKAYKGMRPKVIRE